MYGIEPTNSGGVGWNRSVNSAVSSVTAGETRKVVSTSLVGISDPQSRAIRGSVLALDRNVFLKCCRWTEGSLNASSMQNVVDSILCYSTFGLVRFLAESCPRMAPRRGCRGERALTLDRIRYNLNQSKRPTGRAGLESGAAIGGGLGDC
ncbi:hypothetical protein CIHG_10521 [Coccidioides immitis H538.4]|uniref:Uncharacterized protein n=2 Tax=Coccidioides immitis TaxID=5501 RepID=A0A0P6QHV7_COCIT|nr:hypothetical protein CIRG_03847 [Coccidioides immitis RMSCC 2394]KMU82161.1 hypothetical protein CIHG_10521 [Coccidioides immitis H538.4]